MFIVRFGFGTAIERYAACILNIKQIGLVRIYICLDAFGISEGYSSSAVYSHLMLLRYLAWK